MSVTSQQRDHRKPLIEERTDGKRNVSKVAERTGLSLRYPAGRTRRRSRNPDHSPRRAHRRIAGGGPASRTRPACGSPGLRRARPCVVRSSRTEGPRLRTPALSRLTLGIEFDPGAAWNERKKLYEH